MRLLLLLNSFLLLGLICTNVFHFVSDSRKQVTTIGILRLLSLACRLHLTPEALCVIYSTEG